MVPVRAASSYDSMADPAKSAFIGPSATRNVPVTRPPSTAVTTAPGTHDATSTGSFSAAQTASGDAATTMR